MDDEIPLYSITKALEMQNDEQQEYLGEEKPEYSCIIPEEEFKEAEEHLKTASYKLGRVKMRKLAE
jgi:hypothetical protein